MSRAPIRHGSCGLATWKFAGKARGEGNHKKPRVEVFKLKLKQIGYHFVTYLLNRKFQGPQGWSETSHGNWKGYQKRASGLDVQIASDSRSNLPVI